MQTPWLEAMIGATEQAVLVVGTDPAARGRVAGELRDGQHMIVEGPPERSVSLVRNVRFAAIALVGRLAPPHREALLLAYQAQVPADAELEVVPVGDAGELVRIRAIAS
jgi:hypothetical protein